MPTHSNSDVDDFRAGEGFELCLACGAWRRYDGIPKDKLCNCKPLFGSYSMKEVKKDDE